VAHTIPIHTIHDLTPRGALTPHVALLVALSVMVPHAQGPTTGVQDPAWAPDARQVAVSYLDRIWTMTPEGRRVKAVTTGPPALEREPAWSPDGSRLAFAANRGEGFDIFVVSANGGTPTAVTARPGDERWPSWTPDGRLVFAHRGPAANGRPADPARQWDLFVATQVSGSTAWQAPVRLTDTIENETHPRVSPDGRYVAFVSDRDSVEDVDVFAFALPPAGVTTPVPLSAAVARTGASGSEQAGAAKSVEKRAPAVTRITRVRGDEAALSWAPDSERLAFYAVRDGVGSVWVAAVEPPPQEPDEDPVARPKPSAPPLLVSRTGGAPAWSPDGRTLLVAGLPDPQPVYNGNPLRSESDAPPLFASTHAFQLFRVPAPMPVHAGGTGIMTQLAPTPALYDAAFQRTWQTLRDLYYSTGAAADAWQRARDTYQPRAVQARSAAEFEEIVDDMIAAQPLIKPVVTSSGAVIVSGHPLASEAGRQAIEKGGNIVDAMVAVSFALGVVEPEASGIGGDGSAVLFLKGMTQPTVIEYKDQTPIRATPDNPAIFSDGRLVADGPAAANIPGVVGGLDYLYRKYGSGKVKWAELIEPAIALADEGFILDDALPTSLAVGRSYLEKYPEAARIYLPGGNVPRPGDRFVNKDYATTLRALARDGAETFYRGDIARKIAADMEENGGILTYEDLAQYRAIEREPVRGQYRGHTLYAGGPPVSTGIQLFESLQILEHYQPRPGARPTTDADYFHYLIEAWKVRDPIRRVADPERWPVDFAEHLTPAHARAQFQKINPRRAMPYARVPPDTEPFQPLSRIGTGTTSFAVADADGNMIAVTQTLSTWGGTFYVSKGLGFLYNNHLRSSRTTPGYGRLVPLMRSSTASVPTLVFENAPGGDVPRLAVGAAGNAWIPLSVYNIITAVVDGRLGAQSAIEAPRFLPGRDPADPLDSAARVEIEDRFPRALLDDLTARGHRFQKIGRKGEVRYGYAAAIVVDISNQKVEGGAEPRRSHAAVAARP
jgi:gamma-glutamyltranspeptidase/glutathione hydrolase